MNEAAGWRGARGGVSGSAGYRIYDGFDLSAANPQTTGQPASEWWTGAINGDVRVSEKMLARGSRRLLAPRHRQLLLLRPDAAALDRLRFAARADAVCVFAERRLSRVGRHVARRLRTRTANISATKRACSSSDGRIVRAGAVARVERRTEADRESQLDAAGRGRAAAGRIRAASGKARTRHADRAEAGS